MTIACDVRTFIASDAYELHYRHWMPDCATPRGYIVALHGIQSHSGWYGYSSAKLAAAGYDVRFLDRRGSGLNPAQRGDALHGRRLVNDVVQFLNGVREDRKKCGSNAPVILLAVSWGAKVAASLAAARDELIDALVLLYPGICSDVRVVWHQRLRLKLARSLEIRDKTIRIPLDDPALFTPVPQWQKFIADDKLSLHETTVGFLNSSLDLDALASEAPEKICVPTLVMLAGRDRIIDNAATRKYFARIAAPVKTLEEYAEAGHTLEFEPNRDEIFDRLISWLSNLSAGVSVPSTSASGPRIDPPHVQFSATQSASSLRPEMI